MEENKTDNVKANGGTQSQPEASTDSTDTSQSKVTGSDEPLEASFSALILSLASSAAVSMGLSPHPETGKVHKNLKMTQFNIDLLVVLREKTKNNLTQEEETFLNSLISDLQTKFIQNR